MAYEYVNAAYYEGASTTTPTHAVGDLLIVVAIRWGSTTPPSLPAGWMSVHTGTNTDARRVGYKVATATNDSTGTWTNANAMAMLAYRGLSSLASAASAYSGSSAADYPALPLGGTRPVITLGISSGSGQMATPAGCTSRWADGYSRIADTATAVSSWPGTDGGSYAYMCVSMEAIESAMPVSTTLEVSRSAAGPVSTTLAVSRSAAQWTVSTSLAVSRQSSAPVSTSLAVSRSAETFGTWRELTVSAQWLQAVAAKGRTIESRAELVDANGVPQPITVAGVTSWDLPLSAASVEFRGEQPEQWSASMAFADPWMVPTTSAHPLWGARSMFVRLWWRVWAAGTWLEMPVCTVAVGNTAATDDGSISGTVRGRDVLSLLRGGYGAPLNISGATIDVALRAIFERCAPGLPVRIAPTSVLVPADTVLGEKDPLGDVLELAGVGYSDGTVRSDREGVVECGPRPEPTAPMLDWQEGPDCPVSELSWEHGIEHMGNIITAVSTHADAVGLYVTVQDDDPSSPTYVNGPMGKRPLPSIDTDKATTEAALRSLALMHLGKGLHPTEDVEVTVPQRPDLVYEHPVLLGRAQLGVASVYRVSSWSVNLPGNGETPSPMRVGMMRRTVR